MPASHTPPDGLEAVNLDDLISDTFDYIIDAFESPRAVITALPALDNAVKFLPGELWLVAGRAGSGHVSLAHRVAIQSTEPWSPDELGFDAAHERWFDPG